MSGSVLDIPVAPRPPHRGGPPALPPGDGAQPLAVLPPEQDRWARTADFLFPVLLGVFLAAVAFAADGGLRLEEKTYVEIVLIVTGAVVSAAALIAGPRTRGRRRQQIPGGDKVYGAWPLAIFGALAVVTALSITWSLNGTESWLETSRTLSYLSVFAGALGFVRLATDRWASVLHGIALASVIMSGYAVLTKVFPGALAPDELYGRLREPFGYWNAVGLMAALGVPPLLWLAARRSGHAILGVLAYPALGLCLTTIMLSFSRGALLALVLGLAFWFAVTPLRLRAAAALLSASLGTVLITLWAFSQDGLVQDNVVLEDRADAGHELGVLIVIVLFLLLVVGAFVGFRLAQSAPSRATRQLAAKVIVAGLLSLPVMGLVALAVAPGGIDGQVSKAWKSLTQENAKTPPNTPARLTQTASVRARYWRESTRVWSDHVMLGAGAGAFVTARTRYRTGALQVRHSHGYIVQTVADLGLVGLGLTLALLATWLLSAIPAAGLRRRDKGRPYPPERVALLTMFAVVVVFGVHSTIDWTWFVPGCAVPALICAGWLAGRGPLFGATRFVTGTVPGLRPQPAAAGAPPAAAGEILDPAPRRRRVPRDLAFRAGAAAFLLVIALAASWATLQPLRSDNAVSAASDRLAIGQTEAARSILGIAKERNPLNVDPYFMLSAIDDAEGNTTAAVRHLEQAAEVQPASVEVWRQLGRYLLDRVNSPEQAEPPLRAAYYLDPHSARAISDYLEVTRALNGGQAPAAPVAPAPTPAPSPVSTPTPLPSPSPDTP